MNRFEMRATAAGTAELLIYGDIGPDFFAEESNDAITVAKKIQAVGDADLDVRISSYGGSLADALVIYNALQRHKGKTTAHIDGLAYSAASLIPLGCGSVKMASNATMMIHAPHTPMGGNATKLRETADVLDTIAGTLVDSYARGGRVDADQMKSWLMDGEDHYLSAAEAFNLGLIDEVTGAVEVAASFQALTRFKSPDASGTTLTDGATEMAGKDDQAEKGQPEATDNFLMEHKSTLKAGVAKGAALENQRQSGIRMAFDGLVDLSDAADEMGALMESCLKETDCTVEKANVRIIKMLKEQSDDPVIKPFAAAQAPNGGTYRKSQQNPNMNPAIGGADAVDKFVMGATKALEIRAGIETDAEKINAERAGEFLSMSLIDLAKHSLRMSGLPVSGSADDIARRIIYAAGPGQGTDHFPAILENIAEKSVMDGFMAAEETWQSWTQAGTLNDYRTASRVNKSLFDTLDKMEEFEAFKAGRFADVKQSITGYLHGKSFSLSLQSIVNDDLGILGSDARSWGESASTTIGDAVFLTLTLAGTGGYGQTMTEDSKILFHADHGNYIASGSGAAPSETTIGAGRTAMMGQTDPNGRQVASRPRYLMHGTTLTMAVIKLLNSQSLITGEDATMGERNPVQTLGLQSIEEYRIDDFVSTSWLLAAARRTVEVAFVGGQRTPTVNRMPPGEIPGISYQISIPFGVAALDYRTMYLNYGA